MNPKNIHEGGHQLDDHIFTKAKPHTVSTHASVCVCVCVCVCVFSLLFKEEENDRNPETW